MMLDISLFLLGLNVNSTAVLYASFVNGVYMVNGNTVSIGDIFSEDLARWGAFNPSLIQDGIGLVCDTDFPDTNIALTGQMFDLTTGPFTGVAECYLNDSEFALFGFSNSYFEVNGQYLRLQMNGIAGSDPGGVVLDGVQTDPDTGFPSGLIGSLTPSILVEGINRVAWSRSATKLSLSINGAAVISYVGTPYMGELLDLSGIFITGTGCILKEFSIYELADDDDLPTLSTL